MKHRVNLFISGHYHNWERSCPVAFGKCREDGKAPVHIVAGTAGFSFGDQRNYETAWMRKFIADSHGFARLTVYGSERLRVSFLGGAACDEVLDEVTVTPY